MYTPVYTKQFEKDIKRCKRRGKNLEKLKILARTLLTGQPLDPIHRDHKLVGNYVGRQDCHIESDWVLIYKIDGTQMIFVSSRPCRAYTSHLSRQLGRGGCGCSEVRVALSAAEFDVRQMGMRHQLLNSKSKVAGKGESNEM